MAHRIQPPRRNLTYAVVDMDGTPLTWHHSAAAAQRAIDREWRAFRRRYPADGSLGNATAYLPRSIVCVPPQGRYIERVGQYSTSWDIVCGGGAA